MRPTTTPERPGESAACAESEALPAAAADGTNSDPNDCDAASAREAEANGGGSTTEISKLRIEMEGRARTRMLSRHEKAADVLSGNISEAESAMEELAGRLIAN
jgi:hypothetical protein